MTSWLERVKHQWRRAGDKLAGRDVEVGGEMPELIDEGTAARPDVDVLESDGELMLVADVPGAMPDSVAVHHEAGRLAIYARSAAFAGELIGGAGPCNWLVRFALPEGIDGDHIHASVRDGVLTVQLPKAERPEPVRIPVRPG